MPFLVLPLPAQRPASLDGLMDRFADLPDHRVQRGLRHKLLDIVFMAICATVSAADDWVAVEVFCKARVDWFRKYLELPNGIPSHDTFGEVFRYLDAEAFESCFRAWMAEICLLTDLKHVAIDGKTMRSSGGPDQRCLHVVSAFATANGVTLGHRGGDEVNRVAVDCAAAAEARSSRAAPWSGWKELMAFPIIADRPVPRSQCGFLQCIADRRA